MEYSLYTVAICTLVLIGGGLSKSDILSRVKHLDDRKRNTNYGKVCFENDIKPQANLNITSFMGVWVAIAQTIPLNEYVLESGITAHLYRGDQQFQVKHAGYIKNHLPPNSATPLSHFEKNRCVGPSILECWQDTQKKGFIHAHFLDGNGDIYSNTSFKIIYTDYQISVLYSCHKLDATGKRCLPEHVMVSINARKNKIPKGDWCKILELIKYELCIDPNNLYIVSREYNCKHMLELESGILDLSNYKKRSARRKSKKRSDPRQKRSNENIMLSIHQECLSIINTV